MNKEIFVKLLAQRQFKAVRSSLDVMNEVDIASLLSDLDDKELALAFRLICFAKFYFNSYFLNLSFLLKLELSSFFQSVFKLFPKIFRPNFLSRRLSL